MKIQNDVMTITKDGGIKASPARASYILTRTHIPNTDGQRPANDVSKYFNKLNHGIGDVPLSWSKSQVSPYTIQAARLAYQIHANPFLEVWMAADAFMHSDLERKFLGAIIAYGSTRCQQVEISFWDNSNNSRYEAVGIFSGDKNKKLTIRPQRHFTTPDGRIKADFEFEYFELCPGSLRRGQYWQSHGLLVVECDGKNYHHIAEHQASSDYRRDRFHTNAGRPFYRFTGADVNSDPIGCAKEVMGQLEEWRTRLR